MTELNFLDELNELCRARRYESQFIICEDSLKRVFAHPNRKLPGRTKIYEHVTSAVEISLMEEEPQKELSDAIAAHLSLAKKSFHDEKDKLFIYKACLRSFAETVIERNDQEPLSPNMLTSIDSVLVKVAKYAGVPIPTEPSPKIDYSGQKGYWFGHDHQK